MEALSKNTTNASPNAGVESITLPARLTGVVLATVKNPVFWSACVFACSFVLLYLRIGTHSDMYGWYQGDSLFPVHVAQDFLLQDFSLRGWRFCPSNYVFPDAVIAGVFYLFTGNSILSSFLSGVFFVTMTVLGYCYLGHVCHLGEARTRNTLVLLGGAIFILFFVATMQFEVYFVLLIPAIHSGAYMLIIWMTGLLISIIYEPRGTPRRKKQLWILALLTLLTATGEPLILPMFVAAATAAGLACWLGGLIERRKLDGPIWMLWSVSIVGILGSFLLIDVSSPRAFARPGLGRSWIALKNFIGLFSERLAAGDLMHWLGVIWMVGCLGTFLYYVIQRKPNEGNAIHAAKGRVAFLAAYLLLSALGMLAAPIVGGHSSLVDSLNYGYLLHYWHPFIYGPIFTLPLLLAVAFRNIHVPNWIKNWSGVTVGAPSLIAMIVVMSQIGIGDYLPHTGRTQFVVEVDAIIAKHKLHRGVTNFWKSRAITTMTNSDVRTVPIMPNFEFHDWMHNSRDITENRFNSGEYVPFDFAVASASFELPASLFIARFGEPACIEKIGADIEVLIYNRPEDEQFHRLFRSPYESPGYRNLFAAADLPSLVGELEDEERVAEFGRDDAGVLTYGPCIKLPAGNYSIAFQFSAENETKAPVGSWDILLSEQNGKAVKSVASGTISPDKNEIRYELNVEPNQENSLLEARVHYSGSGRIAVKGIELLRLR